MSRLKTHTIAEYVTPDRCPHGFQTLAVIWRVIIWDALSIRAPRYSITPVTRVTGDCDAPGSHGNMPDNCEYFNTNISPQLNIITRRHTSVSIQSSVQTRAAGVGKCPNNTCFIMQCSGNQLMRLASCVTLWDPEQSHEPLLILIHVLIASSIAPLYGWASPHLLSQMRPNILSSNNTAITNITEMGPSPVTCHRQWYQSGSIHSNDPDSFLQLLSVKDRVSRKQHMSHWSQSRPSMIHDVM